MSERDYIKGTRAAYASMLQTCVSELGYTSDAGSKAAWIIEREAAIAKLREVCADHGDNNWPELLHLADIIEKHLTRHLG